MNDGYFSANSVRSTEEQLIYQNHHEVMKIHYDLMENYLSLKRANVTQTNMEILDTGSNIEYTHIIYVTVWVKIGKGHTQYAKYVLTDVDLRLNCNVCNDVKKIVEFRPNNNTTCNGLRGDHIYPGQILARYQYNISSIDETILLSTYKIGIQWKTIVNDGYSNKMSSHDPTGGFGRAFVKLSCKHCSAGNILSKLCVQTNARYLSGMQYSWDGNIVKCGHVKFQEHIMYQHSINKQLSQPFVKCLKVNGNYNEDIAQLIYDVLEKQVSKELIDYIVYIASGLWLTLTDN